MMRLALLLIPALLFAQPKDQERAGLEGRVVNAVSGEGVRRARVTLQVAPPGRGEPVSVTSEGNGRFAFKNLEPGNYILILRHTAFAMTMVGISPNSARRDFIVLAAGENKNGLLVRMNPYGAIAGRVVDEDGDPVKGLRVSAMLWEYTTRGRRLMEKRSAITDDLGDYRLYDAMPGKYLMRVAPEQTTTTLSPDEESFAATYYPNAPAPNFALPVLLSPGQQLRGLNFTLRRVRYAGIRGRVVAPEGASDIMVELNVRAGGTRSGISHGIRDRGGQFELYGVPPGQFNLTGSYSVGGRRFVVQLPIEVGSSEINGLELRPVPSMSVAGQVRIEGETRRSPSDVKVQLEAPDWNYVHRAEVDGDGQLTIRTIEPDVWLVLPFAPPDLYVKSIHWGTADITDTELDLTGGVPPRTELSIVLAADGGEVSGVVRNDKQEAVDGAVVTLVPAGGSKWCYRTVNTDAGGRFMIRAIAPGSYRLWAWDKVDPNAVMFDPDFLTPYKAAAVPVEIKPGEKKPADLTITTM